VTGADLVKRLGAFRDGLLVSSSVVYLLGYATWSIYAWRTHLGPVSAVDAQYFAAGLPIALGLLCTLGSVVALRHLADVRWRSLVQTRSVRWRHRVVIILMVCGLAPTMLTGVILVRVGTKNIRLGLAVALFALLSLAYIIVPLLSVMVHPTLDRFARIAPAVVLTLFGGLGVAYFALDLYPSIPASLGGGRPRLVLLDIRPSSVAPETLRMLLPPKASILTGTTLRTRELDLLAVSGQYYLIGIPSLQAASPPVRLQLERSSVVAVIWTE
jgi:hypothetical protein